MTIKYTQWLRGYVGPQRLMQIRASGLIRNEAGHVLLAQRADVMLWDVPGGSVELGETPATALVRELSNETGLQVVPQSVIGVYAGPDWAWTYPNGDQADIFNILIACTIAGGRLTLQGRQNLRIAFFPTDALPSLLPRTARMFADVLAGREGHCD